ncbi:MAG: hypothetical protein BGN92_13960 [Sphingobacteriales bacterium 41-5]|nr:MAG: hypothetical protein BGN92_13960 [Sphingobacteriales bacterium 41-5]
MSDKNLPFYSMVFLALVLMGLIIATQLFTDQSMRTVRSGNAQTVETFKVNNRMQNIVNLSFDLQTKLSNQEIALDTVRRRQLYDSVFMLGYNSTILTRAVSKLGFSKDAKNIEDLVTAQVNHLSYILVTENTGNRVVRDSLMDSLNRAQFGDRVYEACLEVQNLLEQSLEQTLIKNSEQASVHYKYNRITAVVAILAILIMATIIINRQVRQIKLIGELRTAEATALKSKNAKDDFVANMSHELRTPLNALIGFGNLLNQTDLDPKQQEYVDVIRSGGYNLLNIVNDVLDLSKIEAGKLRIVNKPFNIITVLKNIERMFSENIAEKRLVYEWHIDEKIPPNLKGDSERLKQILINLIGNAIKFTNEGGIQLNAGIVWVDEESGMYKLVFTVKDSGAGIPKEKVQKIFERFEQLEHVTTRQHGGTGLGLTIVKNLVEKMGGAISVYSEPGEGSEFSFTCIFEKALSLQEDEQVFDKTNFSLENYSLLAAEDNKANQTLLRHLLGRYKAEVTIVENGREAVELLKKNSYDLVLMDIQMPLMDGYTAVNKIRQELKNHITVIAMTAYVSEDEIQKCLNSGFNDYLAKPIDESTLLKILSTYLNHAGVVVKKETKNANNFDYLRELIGDDPEAIKEIIGEMKVQWSLDKADLEHAVKANDIPEVKRILHRVKSTLSPLGPGHQIYLEVSDSKGNLASTENLDVEELTGLISRIDILTESLQLES